MRESWPVVMSDQWVFRIDLECQRVPRHLDVIEGVAQQVRADGEFANAKEADKGQRDQKNPVAELFDRHIKGDPV